LLTLILIELCLCLVIINVINYTEIDWVAYNEQVDIWQSGERNYLKIRGTTGPLVYPAGFLYLYAALQYMAGGDGHDIFRAQLVFVVLYLLNLTVVFLVYHQSSKRVIDLASATYPRKKSDDAECNHTHDINYAHVVWSLRLCMILCCLSKRIHSIFILRLFNDAPTMLLFYFSVLLFSKRKWKTGCVVYSMAVSIKMNVLLSAPGLLLLFLQSTSSLRETIYLLTICASVQVVIGFPFLKMHPWSYLRKAFELDRAFFYKWTVNWKMFPEDIFLSKYFSMILLLLHLTFLFIFLIKCISAHKKEYGRFLFFASSSNGNITPEYISYVLFVSNFIGIAFSRTLHYQFYSWYFHTIPFLLWSTSMPLFLRLIVFFGIEYAYNVYPATSFSSSTLQLCHFTVFVFLLFGKVPRIFK